jgi:hypothetical protein
MANTTKLKLEIADDHNMQLLAEKYPDAVKKVVEVREDHTRLYALAKAHLTIGVPIPGVKITTPDGRVLDGTTEPKQAGLSLRAPGDDAA